MTIRSRFRFDLIRIWSTVSIVLLSVPTAMLLFYGLVIYRSPLGFGSPVFMSIELTLFSSAVAAAIVFIVFTPVAYQLSRQRDDIIETASDIPVSIPHPIIGISLLLLGSVYTPTGRFLHSIGFSFFYTIQGMISALVMVSAPIYIRSAQSLFSATNRDAELFASSMGASRLRILYSILIPSSARNIVSASLTTMGRAMSEYGAVAILAYYVLQRPFVGFEPAPVLIVEYYSVYGTAVAVTAASVMILFSIAVMIGVRAVRSRQNPW